MCDFLRWKAPSQVRAATQRDDEDSSRCTVDENASRNTIEANVCLKERCEYRAHASNSEMPGNDQGGASISSDRGRSCRCSNEDTKRAFLESGSNVLRAESRTCIPPETVDIGSYVTHMTFLCSLWIVAFVRDVFWILRVVGRILTPSPSWGSGRWGLSIENSGRKEEKRRRRRWWSGSSWSAWGWLVRLGGLVGRIPRISPGWLLCGVSTGKNVGRKRRATPWSSGLGLVWLVWMMGNVKGCTITDSNLNGYVDDWIGGNTNPGGCGPISGWDVSRVTSLFGTFWEAGNFNGDLSSWDVASVTSLYRTFASASNFNGDLSSWNVAKVTSLAFAFSDASTFNGDLSSWNVAKVTSLSYTFNGASTFNGDLSSWNVAKVTSLYYTFSEARNFNGDLSSWNVAKVTTSLGHTFSDASDFNGDLSSWNVAKVTSLDHTFSGASAFNGDLSSWNVAKVTSLDHTFTGASTFNGDLSSWNVAKVTSMYQTFSDAGAFNGESAFNGDLSSWNVASVTALYYTFSGANDFNGDLSSWNVARVTTLYYTFNDALAFNGDLSSWNVASVTSLGGTFARASNFNGDLSSWNVARVTALRGTFFRASNFNGNLSSWNIAGVTSLSQTFYGASTFNGDLSSWNVAKVTSLYQTFYEASTFNGDLSSWNVASVTSLDYTFLFASTFNGDLSSWNVASVTSLGSTFGEASSFNGDLSSWNVAKVTSLDYTFYGGSSFNGDLSSWNVAKVTSLYYTFYNASTFNGDLSSWNVASVTTLAETFSGASNFDSCNKFNVRRSWSFRSSVAYSALSWPSDRPSPSCTCMLHDINFQDSIDEMIQSNSKCEDVSLWDVSRITSLVGTFFGASGFNGDLSNWNVARVTSLSSTFAGASAFNADLSLWNVARVGSLDLTFSGASSFNTDLSSWNIAKVTSMINTFGTTTSLSGCVKAALYEGWKTNPNFLAVYGEVWKIAKCDTFLEYLNFFKQPECGYGTISCTCTYIGDVNITCTPNCGTIPAALGDCVELVQLNMTPSSANGGGVVGTIPTELGRLARLQVLDLGRSSPSLDSTTGLNGTIPSELGLLTQLVTLNLGGVNTLHGPIPTELGELTTLETLALDGTNTLTGSIPPHLGNLSHLRRLHLGGGTNRLSGPIPSELGRLSNLTSLDLFGNDHLNGTIPASFGDLTRLERLVLSANDLRSPIPESVLGLTDLREIYLDRNAFNGTIPSSRNLSSLRVVHLDRNDFSGSIPADHFDGNPSLEVVHVGYNRFEGDVPTFEGLSNLRTVQMMENAFSRVPRRSFAGIAERDVMIDLSAQDSPLVLDERAFEGHRRNATYVLTGNRISTIPSRCFDGLSDARLDLGNLQIQKLEADAFMGTANVNIDLSSNYITSVHPFSFPRPFVHFANATNCTNAFGWDETCATLRGTVEGSCSFERTCDDGSSVRFEDESGLTAREACCVFGGGFSTGTALVMDAASPVTCEVSQTNQSRVTCRCSNTHARFDMETHECRTSCVSGQYWIPETDPDMLPGSVAYVHDAMAGRCVSCDKGKFGSSENFNTECEACVAGKYSSVNQSTACTSCPRGEFSDTANATACKKCSPGQYNPSIESDHCKACEPGSFSSSNASIVCAPCEAGTFASSNASSVCQVCGAGSSTDVGSRATACTNCVAGKYAPSDQSTACLSCPRGEFSDTVNATKCKECSPGSYGSSTGVSECSVCEAGFFSSSNASVNCVQCPRGLHAPDNGTSACVPCVPGKYTDAVGQRLCKDALPGYDASSNNAPCRSNTYAPAGASACITCPTGKKSAEAASECESCTFMYMLSEHCEEPRLGYILLPIGLLVVLSAAYVLRRYFSKRLEATETEARRTKSMYDASRDDISQMESAWRIDWTTLDIEESLAAGGFGEVWRGVMNGTYDVAIKKMFHTERVDLNEETEIHFLKRARHPKLVMFMGCGYIENDPKHNLFVVLEYMNHGDLRDLLWEEKRDGKPAPPWSVRISALKDTAEGMAYLHETLGKLHRDLKSPNILIHKPKRGRLVAKVADFGLAKATRNMKRTNAAEGDDASKTASDEPSDVSMTSFRGSIMWMAPEVFPKEGNKPTMYGKPIDVYSFGIVLWESLALKAPWSHDGDRFHKGPVRMKIVFAVEKGERPPITKDMEVDAPTGFSALIRRCWDGSAEKRPPFIELVFALHKMELEVRKRELSNRLDHPASRLASNIRGVADRMRRDVFDSGTLRREKEDDKAFFRRKRSRSMFTLNSMLPRSKSERHVATIEMNAFASSHMLSSDDEDGAVVPLPALPAEDERPSPKETTRSNARKLLDMSNGTEQQGTSSPVHRGNTSPRMRSVDSSRMKKHEKARDASVTAKHAEELLEMMDAATGPSSSPRGMRRSSIAMVRKASLDARSVWNARDKSDADEAHAVSVEVPQRL